MSVLSAQTIRRLGLVQPLLERGTFEGMTFGLGPAGYDITLDGDCLLRSTNDFVLAAAYEQFDMPDDVLGVVHDKSSWARKGLLVQNTVIEPGWRGHLTLELTWHGVGRKFLAHGTPIAQVVFHRLDEPTCLPYRGKYQDQRPGPQPAKEG